MNRPLRAGSLGRSLLLVLLLGCTRSEPEERALSKVEPSAEETHRDEPEHAPLRTRVRLRPEVIAAAKVSTAPAKRERLARTVALPGELVADPDRSALVSSPIAGRIEKLSFKEGQRVAQGELLAAIGVPDLGKLRSTRSAVGAQARAARANAERLKGLVGEQLAAEQAYLDALANAEALEVEARAAGEQLSALGIPESGGAASVLSLRAPISGVVIARQAVIGQPVNPAQVLAEIVDLSELWFLARVFEQDLGQIAIGARAEVQLNAHPHERFVGVVEYIGQQVDPAARTVTARVRLTNRDDLLRVGLFGTAYVSLGQSGASELALVVPRSALIEVAGKQGVFVRQADGDFDLHEVVLGASAAGKVEILAGLREGEQVVVEGAFTLKSAVLKGTFAEDE